MNKLDLTDYGKMPDLLLTLQENAELKKKLAKLDAVLWEIKNGLREHDADPYNGLGGKTIGLMRIKHALASVGVDDANLISAAVELYRACEELEASSDYWGEYDVSLGIVDRLKAGFGEGPRGRDKMPKTEIELSFTVRVDANYEQDDPSTGYVGGWILENPEINVGGRGWKEIADSTWDGIKDRCWRQIEPQLKD